MELKDYVKFIKENLALIAIVPTVMGGIIQVIELATIHPVFLRFFSISQLVCDGLLFVVMFFLASVLMLIIWFCFRLSERIEILPRERFLIQWDLFFLGITYFIIALDAIIELNGGSYSSFTVTFVVFFLFTFCLALKPETEYIRNEIKKKLMVTAFILILLFGFNFVIGEDLSVLKVSNFKRLLTEIDKKECYSLAPKIVYFNDKYIFIETDLKGKKEIVIKKMDDLFE